MLRVLRVVRLLQVYRLRTISDSRLHRQVLALIFTIFSLIFCAAGVIQVVETELGDAEMPFHTAFYFVVVTITTVGYGDITPDTTIGQFVVIIVIILAVILVPQQFSRVYELASQLNGASGSVNPKSKHFIVTGYIDESSMMALMRELAEGVSC